MSNKNRTIHINIYFYNKSHLEMLGINGEPVISKNNWLETTYLRNNSLSYTGH